MQNCLLFINFYTFKVNNKVRQCNLKFFVRNVETFKVMINKFLSDRKLTASMTSPLLEKIRIYMVGRQGPRSGRPLPNP